MPPPAVRGLRRASAPSSDIPRSRQSPRAAIRSLNPGILLVPLRIISLMASSFPLTRSLYRSVPIHSESRPRRRVADAAALLENTLPQFLGIVQRLWSGLPAARARQAEKCRGKSTKPIGWRIMEDAPRQTLPRKAFSSTRFSLWGFVRSTSDRTPLQPSQARSLCHI